MTAIMKLTTEGCIATFDPDDGGRLTSFRVGDRELLVAQGKDVFHFGSFVMAPWVGRLRDARLNYGGDQYRFAANSGPHALHGLVTERPWRVTGDGELSIELGEPWPWPCRVVQRTELSARRATFRIEVYAREAMPAAVGWHPWFVRRLAGAPTSAELELDVQPGLMWANDFDRPAQRQIDRARAEALGLLLPRPAGRSDRALAWRTRSSPSVPTVKIGSSMTWKTPGCASSRGRRLPNSLNMPNPRIVTPDAPLMASMTWTWR